MSIPRAYRIAIVTLIILLTSCSLSNGKPSDLRVPEQGIADEVMVTWKGQSIVRRADYTDWLAWRGLREQVNHLVEFATLQVLAAQAREREHDAHRTEAFDDQVKSKVLAEALLTRVKKTATVDQDALNRAWTASGGRELVAKRWQLRNLYLRFPRDSQGRAAVYERIGALRAEAMQGGDFAALAAAHSDSQTRFREGRLGLMPLSRLPTAVARAVEPLRAGEVSRIVETGDGLSIFYCERVVDAQIIEGDALRERIHHQLLMQAQQRARSELDRSLLTAAGLPAGEPVSERRLSELHAQQAIADGLDRLPAVQQQIRWQRLTQRAQRELQQQVLELPEIASESELRAEYARLQARGNGLQRFRVAGIDFGPADSTNIDRAQAVEADIKAGRLAFGEAAQRHSLDATGANGGDLGWFDVRTLAARDWIMMRAIRQLAVNQLSGLIHSNDGLWLYQLTERQSGADVRFEDVRDDLESRIRRGLERSARQQLRAQIASELTILACISRTCP